MRLIDADAYEYPGDLVHMPTIDAEPVVRCRACKWYELDCGYCDYWDTGRRVDDYCSRGVKMGADPKPPEPRKVCPATGLECIECVPGYGCAKTEGGASDENA